MNTKEKTYYRVFTAPADWKDESKYHYIAEFSKYDFAFQFIKEFRLNPKYQKYNLVIKEVNSERTNAAEGRRVSVISIIGGYLEVNGKPIED